MTFHLFNCFSR